MRYLVTVQPRKGSWTTYYRGGYCFDSTRPNVLEESQLNDAMRADPRLTIEPELLPGAEPIIPARHPPMGELLPLPVGGPVELVLGVSGSLVNDAGDPINDPADVLPAIKCTSTTKAGRPCSAWALEGTDRCRMHPRD